MFRAALANLVAHRRRLWATFLAITLGVSFMAGTLVLTDTVTQTFNNLFATVYRGTDAVVRGVSAFNGVQNSGAQRAPVDAASLPALQRVQGVATAEGVVEGYARIIGSDGQALGNPSSGAPTIGFSWISDPRLDPFTLAAGRPPSAPDEVVIDQKSATDGHLAIGDRATILGQGPPRQFLITGIVRFGGADSPGGASCALFAVPTAQEYVGQPGKYSYLAFVAKPGISQPQLVRNLQPALPAGLEAVTGTQVTHEAQTQIGKSMSIFNSFMLIFAVVALLVGAFMIFNAFSITLAQRTRENGLLRAVGATRRQVLRSVLLEALVIGALASVVGLALGAGVAVGLKALLGAMGIDIPSSSMVFSTRSMIVALAAGIGITVFAARSPARRAARVSPMAAIQGSAAPADDAGSGRRALTGVGVLATGIAALFVGLLTSVRSPLLVVGGGAILVFFGVAILGQVISLPLSRVIGAPLPRWRGTAGALGQQNAMRNPRRTASTASALMICVGLVGFMTIFASSARASIDSIVGQAFTGDFVINSGAGMNGGFDPSLTQRLNGLPEVSAATGLRLGQANIGGSPQGVVGLDPNTAFEIINVKPLKGSEQALGTDAIAVYKSVADQKHLAIGDPVQVVFKDTGTKTLHVALIYGGNQPLGNYLLGISAYEANFNTQYDSYVAIKKAPDVTKSQALAAVESVAKDYPGAKVLDEAQYKTQTAQPYNQLLGPVYALLLLAVVIAVLGIGNTLGLSILERTKELGILRAVGMTRRQLRSSIRWEAVIIALQGTLLGLLIGVFFGWALVTALGHQGTVVFSLPYVSMGAIVVLGALAGIVAAVGPARRAAKLEILPSITTE
jgi:putative ABC transport system permease protein